MSQQITTAMIRGYEAGIRHDAQQNQSRLRNAVKNYMLSSEELFIDTLGTTAAQRVDSRHGDTPLTDTPHGRRHVTPYTYARADIIDKADKLRILNDPSSDYTRSFSMAMGRGIDDEIIAAFFATAKTGKDGTGSAAFDTAFQSTDSSNDGLTTARLLAAGSALDAAENPRDEGYFFSCGAAQIEQLLSETVNAASDGGIQFSPVSSRDYNGGAPQGLMSGEVNFYAGFNFIRSERLLDGDVAADVSCPAWAKRSMALGIARDITIEVDRRPDKLNSTQVLCTGDWGATRMDEVGVYDLQCNRVLGV